MAAAAASEPCIRTHFAGFQNQSRISPYYHAADLFVLPSNSETWGLVVNEALHHGLPCVVTEAVGCAADLVEPGVTGEIAATGDADSLAAAIERAAPLMRDPAIREKCRSKISAFTVERAAAGIAKAYWERDGGSRGNVRLLLLGNPGIEHVGAHFREAAAELRHGNDLCPCRRRF